MNWQDSFDGLEFHNDRVLNHEVKPEAGVNCQSVVNHRESHLSLDFETALCEFMNQTRFINTFQQAGAKRGVNRERSVNDLARYCIQFSRDFLPW